MKLIKTLTLALLLSSQATANDTLPEAYWEAKAVDSKVSDGAYGVGSSTDKELAVELAIEACEEYTEESCVIVYVIWKM